MDKQDRDEVISLAIEQLKPFPDHPFRVVVDDHAMEELVDSIKKHGVLTPILARPLDNGTYQIVSGHRRVYACKAAGVKTIPAIVKELDRDAAVIAMVDSNLQREEILPCERGRAYRMRLEAEKHQGARNDLTSAQVGQKLPSAIERLALQQNESKTQVQRYIRLTYLDPDLQQMVDEGRMGVTPAAEISFLKPKEQEMLLERIDAEQVHPLAESGAGSEKAV